MNRWLGILLATWALIATIALAWHIGRASVKPSPTPSTTSPAGPLNAPPPPAAASAAAGADSVARYPQYSSAIPRAFRGRWDEIVADRCEGREARFTFGARQFSNFEIAWDVTRVKLYSPGEIDLYATAMDENANQVSDVWEFKLVDGGKTLTGRKKGGTFFSRCP